MAFYTSFVVAGTGDIGQEILKNLALRKVHIVLLRRPDSTREVDVPEGVVIETADTTDATTLTAIFKAHGTQVVVSAAGRHGYDAQVDLARAAAAAGVKLFVPSEYGFPSDGGILYDGIARNEYNKNVWGVKEDVAIQVRKLGLPLVRIYVHTFIDILPFFLGHTSTNGKLYIKGKGNTPTTWTSVRDIGKFVGTVLTTLKPEELANRDFHIESDRKTLNEIAEIYSKAGYGTIEHVASLPEDTPAREFVDACHDKFEHGGFMEKAGKDKGLLKDYKWQTIEEYVAELAIAK